MKNASMTKKNQTRKMQRNQRESHFVLANFVEKSRSIIFFHPLATWLHISWKWPICLKRHTPIPSSKVLKLKDLLCHENVMCFGLIVWLILVSKLQLGLKSALARKLKHGRWNIKTKKPAIKDSGLLKF